jgi:hypothetical protein
MRPIASTDTATGDVPEPTAVGGVVTLGRPDSGSYTK